MVSSKGENLEIAVIEKELCSFYEYCKENGFTPEEMREICKPLTSMIKKAKLIRYLRYLLFFTIFILFLYFILQTETISWHVSAIGRILMIKILPIWNWQPLFSEKCLINNFANPKVSETNFDCTLCEAIDTIPVVYDIDPYQLSELYLDINVPVILTDGLRNWPVIQNTSFNLTDAILTDEKISKSLPCEMSTNMFSSLSTVETVIQQSLKFKKWFFHFQNCELSAVKQFRIISPRPYFLVPEISPIQYNWLIMSSFYKAPRYKKIDLQEKITIVGQTQGSNFIKLTPRLNCAQECPVLETELQMGEAIIFSELWDFEYKPNEKSHNTVVILETN